jgi:hypothetical protein
MYDGPSRDPLPAPSCNHPDQELRCRRRVNNVELVCLQCLTCGHNCGSKPEAGRDLSKLKQWDPRLVEEWDKRRAAYWEAMRQQFEQDRAEKSRHFSEKYHQHLKSEKWKQLCRHVLARCKGICEGCAEQRAVHVHHLTYEHLSDEFLFELVAVCVPCHEKSSRPVDRLPLHRHPFAI